MHVTRIFTGDDGESHFEDLEIPCNIDRIPAKECGIDQSITGGVQFRDGYIGNALVSFLDDP